MTQSVSYLVAALCAFWAVKMDRFVARHWPMPPTSIVRDGPSDAEWNAFDAMRRQEMDAARKREHANWLIPTVPDRLKERAEYPNKAPRQATVAVPSKVPSTFVAYDRMLLNEGIRLRVNRSGFLQGHVSRLLVKGDGQMIVTTDDAEREALRTEWTDPNRRRGRS